MTYRDKSKKGNPLTGSDKDQWHCFVLESRTRMVTRDVRDKVARTEALALARRDPSFSTLAKRCRI
jgi:hypothetical protein